MSEYGPQSPYCPQCKRGDWFRVSMGHAICTTCGTVMLEGRAAAIRRVGDIPFEYPRYDAAVAEAKRTRHQTTPGLMTFTVLEKR